MSQFLALMFGALACILCIIFAFQNPTTQGLSNEKNIATIFSVVALLVSIGNLYFTFFWHHEDLRLYLRFRDPLQVGTDKLDISYLFTNVGDRSVLVEDIGVLIFFRNAVSLYNPSREFDACATPYLYGQIDIQRFAPPQYRDIGTNMKDHSFLMIYKPTDIYIDGTSVVFSSATIENNKVRSIAATFDATPTNWDKYDTTVICPFVHFFNSKGQPFTAICKGWITTHEPASMHGGMLSGPPAGGPPAQLLPMSENGICTTSSSAAEIG